MPANGNGLKAQDLVVHANMVLDSQAKTAALLGISQPTVSRILETRSPETLGIAKNEMAAKLMILSDNTLSDVVTGVYGKFKSPESAMTCGVAIPLDKAAQLTQGPQVAVQVNVISDLLAACDGLADAIAAAKRQSEPQPVVVEVPAEVVDVRDNAQQVTSK